MHFSILILLLILPPISLHFVVHRIVPSSKNTHTLEAARDICFQQLSFLCFLGSHVLSRSFVHVHT